MLEFLLVYVIIPGAGGIVGWFARRYLSEQTWSSIRKAAYKILGDPEQTDDAKAAVSKALLQANMDQLAKEAERVERAFVKNGSNKIPRLDPDLVEWKRID